MAGVYFNGETITIPGAYSTVDTSAMSTKNDGTENSKVIAFIGECGGSEPETVQFLSDPVSAKKILKSGELLKACNKAWNPVSGTKEGMSVGGANVIACIRTNKATKGAVNIDDKLVIESKDWNALANEIQVRMVNGTIADTKKFIVNDQSTDSIETYDNIGGVFTIKYTGDAKFCSAKIVNDGTEAFFITNIGDTKDTAIEDIKIDLMSSSIKTIKKLLQVLKSYDNYVVTEVTRFNQRIKPVDLDPCEVVLKDTTETIESSDIQVEPTSSDLMGVICAPAVDRDEEDRNVIEKYRLASVVNDTVATVKINANNIVKHANSAGMVRAWVGVGIRQDLLDDTDFDEVKIYCEWDKIDPMADGFDPTKYEAVTPDDSYLCPADNKEYATFYFSGENVGLHNNAGTIWVTKTKDDVTTIYVFNLDFNGVKVWEPIENVNKGITAFYKDLEYNLRDNSNLVVVKSFNNSMGVLDNFDYESLTGGSDGTSENSWIKYFDMLSNFDITYIVPLTSDVSIQAELLSHVTSMSGSKGRERRMIVGGAIGETVQECADRVRTFGNNSRCQVVYGGFYDYNDNGELELYAPYILGAQHAGRCAYLGDGDSATHDVYSMVSPEYKLDMDSIKELLANGILAFEYVLGSSGINSSYVRLVQDLTINTLATSSVDTERATGVLADSINKEIRKAIDEMLTGKKTSATDLTSVKNRVLSILFNRKNINNQIIDYKDVYVTKTGTVTTIEYSVAPAEPNNFTLITAHYYSESITGETETV